MWRVNYWIIFLGFGGFGSLAWAQPLVTPVSPSRPERGDVSVPNISPLPPTSLCPTPRILHFKPARTIYRPGLYPNRIVVKLRDDLGVTVSTSGIAREFIGGTMTAPDRSALNSLNALLRASDVRAVRRAFTLSDAKLGKFRATGQARSCRILADLTQYFWLYLAPDARGEKVVDVLNASPLVEVAFLPPIPRDADAPPLTANMERQQGHLQSANRQGINAHYAHNLSGGRGRSMKVVDIEATWNVNHEDLPPPFFFSGTLLANEISSALNINRKDVATLPEIEINSHHGTAVAGVLVARDNGSGMTGIASDAQWGASSVVRAEALFGVLGWTSGIHDASVADATLRAMEVVDAGDVILIEQHSQGPPTANACTANCRQFEFVPMEYFPDSFDVFSTASALGIIVVEAAGNGTSNLDLNVYEGRFNRTLRDSGAIMVGASQSESRTPNGSSNSGSRIDVHAWGVNVATLGYGDIRANGGDVNQFYTSSFSGTSSASPIVAGAVLSIQGVLKDSGHGVLSPEQMRNLLVRTGTPQATPVTRRIGPMPNLRSALAEFDSGTASAGGSGGAPFTLRCEDGLALVGLRGGAGAVVDRVQPICESAAGAAGRMPAVGGGGTEFTRRCEAGEFVIGMRGRATLFLDRLILECARPGGAGRRRIDSLEPIGGTGGAVFGPNRCTRDRIAVGLQGRAGAFIDQLRLLCSSEQPATVVATPWVSDPVGGTGGAAATLKCDSGQVMVGVTVRSGNWLDSIAPRCATPDATGAWANDARGPRAGGSGGTTETERCPSDHAVSAISGRATALIDKLRIRCRPLASETSTTGEEILGGVVGGNGGTEFGRIACPTDLAATGFAVRTGAYVDQLKLICGH